MRIVVDLKAIKNRRMEDPILQPYDIVEVPSRKFYGDCFDCSQRLKKLPLRLIK